MHSHFVEKAWKRAEIRNMSGAFSDLYCLESRKTQELHIGLFILLSNFRSKKIFFRSGEFMASYAFVSLEMRAETLLILFYPQF